MEIFYGSTFEKMKHNADNSKICGKFQICLKNQFKDQIWGFQNIQIMIYYRVCLR